MSRKTDEELLAEIKKRKKDEANESEEEDDEQVPEIEKPGNQQPVIEREINLALINDKLNFIISRLQQKEADKE